MRTVLGRTSLATWRSITSAALCQASAGTAQTNPYRRNRPHAVSTSPATMIEHASAAARVTPCRTAGVPMPVAASAARSGTDHHVIRPMASTSRPARIGQTGAVSRCPAARYESRKGSPTTAVQNALTPRNPRRFNRTGSML